MGLLHFKTYRQQQENLHLAINTININRANKVLTPKPSSIIAYRRHGHWKYRYGKLGDGTHTYQKVKAQWVKHYRVTIEKNSNNLADRLLGSSPHEVEFVYEEDFSLEQAPVESDIISDSELGPSYSSGEDPDSPVNASEDQQNPSR